MEFCVNYLTLMKENAPQREYPLRAVFNALRYLVRVGGAWRMLPNDLPPWRVVHQQTQRWIKAGCFEAMAHDGFRYTDAWDLIRQKLSTGSNGWHF